MKRYITIIFLLYEGLSYGQTVHSVTVAVGQGAGCPVVSDIAHSQFIHVYPNPASSTLSIQSAMHNAQYRILSIQGKVIKGNRLLGSRAHVDIEGIPGGIYILQLYNGKESRTVKIIIE